MGHPYRFDVRSRIGAAENPLPVDGRRASRVTRAAVWAWLEKTGRDVRRRLFPVSIQVLLTGVLLLVAGVLAVHYLWHITLWHDANQVCNKGQVGCGLVVQFLGTGILAALAFNFVFLRREARAAARWRARAEKTPTELFPWLPPAGGVTGLAALAPPADGKRRERAAERPEAARPTSDRLMLPLIGKILGRDELVEELRSDLAEDRTAQVLVGPTGSGKTMVLLKLAQHLASVGQVPVPLSLRDGRPVNFEQQAREVYRHGSPTWTDEEAEKQWLWLRRNDQITVIVDDLEKADAEPDEVVRALDGAARAGLRVVAASRPGGIPANFKRGRVDLQPLDTSEVCSDLLERLTNAWTRATPRRDAAEVQRIVDGVEPVITQIVSDADIPSTPYFLAIARVLADTRRLTYLRPANRGAARLALLDEYRETVKTGECRPDAALSDETRERVVDCLEAVAYARLWCGKSLHEVSAAVLEFGRPELATSAVVEYAQRLGILEQRYDGVVHFDHPTTLGYFAARFLVRHKEYTALWSRVVELERISTIASLALVFAAVAADDPGVVEATCRGLLARPELAGDVHGIDAGPPVATQPQRGWQSGFYERLMLLKTAAEIARNPGGLKTEVCRKIVKVMGTEPDRAALSREQLGLVREIRYLECDAAYEALWAFAAAAHASYRVRREAVRALVNAAPDAVHVAVKKVGAALADADVYRRLHPTSADDRGEPFETLRAVAWLLPCLRTGASGPLRDQLGAYQDRLLELEKSITEQRGLEGSIAQGLKLDAMWHHAEAPDPLALEMLGGARHRPEGGERRAKFWYSRVLLLQAVTRRSIMNAHTTPALELTRATRDDAREHPFVRETAGLCALALESGDWKPYIWEDMTEVVAGAWTELSADTRQLIGDIVLVLNLNDQRSAKHRLAFGHSRDLPMCLQHSHNRHEILGLANPPERCPFTHDGRCLCPYTYDPPSVGIRRELSRAFCRDRRLQARRLPWHGAIDTSELKAFWRELESRARF